MDSTELNDMHNELVTMERTLYIEDKNHDMLERVRSLIEVTKECLRILGDDDRAQSVINDLECQVKDLSMENSSLLEEIDELKEQLNASE